MKDEEMEVEIIKGIDIKDDSGPCDTFVSFDFSYPKESGNQMFSTPTVKSSLTPVYDFKKVLEITRKKSFLNYVERKKMTFEVFKPGSFFKKAQSLGSMEVKLDDLNTKAEIYQVVQLIKSRKPTGGKLEIKIKLRRPLTGNDVTVINEKFIIVDQHFDAPNLPSLNDQELEDEIFVFEEVESEVEFEVEYEEEPQLQPQTQSQPVNAV